MYKMLGADGHEYGPVTLEQLRQWLAEGRANAQSSIQAEGTTDWKPLSAFPELAAMAVPPALPPAAAPPRPAAAKTNGLAISSLVLGIMGFLTCGLTAIVGLILGIVGLVKIQRSGGRVGGQGVAIAGICASGIAVVMLPMLAGLLLPAMSAARESARRANCLSNLKQIGLGLAMYADVNDGRLPAAERWEDALKAGQLLPADKVLHCPSVTAEGYSYAFNRSMSRGEWQGDPDVVLVVEGKNGWNATVSAPAELSPTNHRAGWNVLFNDGHVEFVTKERIARLRWQPLPKESRSNQ